ncbi:Chromosome partitioning protein ParA [BD1-7 clade bacterium]|uniref:Chromosome partitioning protein ParA n=1 Tax=BD1-7 clade bacterium TaxID=2029982 RepID=A0A5S9N0R4_9GAMM|nr:Chromosome partitioning protein ParA [BD1-7 clade bacterium]CAA0083189.1 Chromosome partitioning protein ParA [BD1-7 clade bacterium]CAA0116700.1 Chromosome partitioning protein ParA [BD1-7 clade bacterium]
MTRVLAIANQKGGVGKTTTTINLAASLAATKKSVLLIDLDPQGNATTGSGVSKHDLELSAYDVLMGEAALEDSIVLGSEAGYDVLGTNADLTGAEIGMLDMADKELQLRNALQDLSSNYDFILMDCPPSLNMLTINALSAADGVIVPMQCEYYALEGLTDLMNTIEHVRSRVNPALKIEGILRTMYDPRNSLTRDVSEQLESHFGDKVYRTCIPRNVRLAEAPSFGLPAIIYDKASRGAMAYLALAGEMIRKEKHQAQPA